jgi:hypothetical protein
VSQTLSHPGINKTTLPLLKWLYLKENRF